MNDAEHPMIHGCMIVITHRVLICNRGIVDLFIGSDTLESVPYQTQDLTCVFTRKLCDRSIYPRVFLAVIMFCMMVKKHLNAAVRTICSKLDSP